MNRSRLSNLLVNGEVRLCIEVELQRVFRHIYRPLVATCWTLHCFHYIYQYIIALLENVEISGKERQLFHKSNLLLTLF